MNKKIVWISTIVGIALVTAVIWMPYLLTPFTPVGQREWKAVAMDANPGAGNCGIVNVLIYPHQSDTSVYNNALSEANAYAHFDSTPSLNEPLEGNVPYNTPFDIVIVAQYNYTVAYNISSNSWDKGYVRCLLTCSALGIGTDTEMSEGNFYGESGSGNTMTIKINFYLNNGGSGYTISHGQVVNITSIKMQGYY